MIALIVAGALFMQQLDGSIIATSLPPMAGSFHARALDLSTGLTVYLLATAAFVPLSGWIADRHGARTVFLLAIAVFTLSSLACGLAVTLPQFIAARAVQGIGGALMVPVGRMVVLRSTERGHLVHAIALLTWPSLAAPILGPALGGFITTYASWRWNFLLNVPLGLAGALLALRHMPDSREAERRALDWPGFVLSASALVLLLYGLEGFAHAIGHWAWPAAAACAGALLAALSARHFRRARQPLLDLESLEVQTYRLCTLDAGLAMRVAINSTPFLLPLLFQLGFGLNAWSAGTLVLVYFAGNMGMKPFTTRMLRWFGFRRLLVGNGLLVGASLLALAAFGPGSPAWALVPVLLLAGAVRSMQFTCLNTLVFADVPDRLRAPANTLASMAWEVASAAGVAVAALLLALAASLRGAQELATADFRWAFLLLGGVALAAAAAFARLPEDAGAVVSGHRAGAAAR